MSGEAGTPLLLHPLFSLPFFAVVKGSHCRPRITAGLLFLAAAFFFQFFGMFQRDNLSIINQGVTFILFLGPLLACGLALLAMKKSEPTDE